MDIILTHEQADFDALASLLGAYLLDDQKVPVLPRRMNRNVRAFLTLYGADLPFIDPRDLNGEPIDSVLLVDTQSMVSIKGMSEKTQVRAIDHHPKRENLPEGWEVTSIEIGAASSLFVEALREHNGPLNTVQATLLLLGIYEDTGSLTYTRTTPRDLRAVAYLIEQGASLEIAGDFLNHPLSAKQQALYERIRDTAEHYHIHGHTIIVGTGEAKDMDEELSSIAHKLRDLLDPDALFLLITTRGGVQMIARSNSDNIDVAGILANFGGGGHERAAAGLIRERDLESLHDELVRILPEYIRPAITVMQIMSRGPQVLAPETPVEEAAQRMRRYGYEGYPVVREGRVVGLLTRRSVDRAIAHRLHLTAASLMDAGEFTVQPKDSIEHLQWVMTDSGWGQVPVVQPETGKIIGIVTRTDLLKTLTPRAKLPSRNNLAGRLSAALPGARLALLKSAARIAHDQHAALYIVGGFVRDLLLERPSQDFDLVVEGDAIKLANSLSRQYGGRVTTHARFGTAKWHIGEIRPEIIQTLQAEQDESLVNEPESGPVRYLSPSDLPESLDLVTARTEFYNYPTALPTVEQGSIKLDLHRRDFTINTLALRLDGSHYGELHDYWGGLNDLRHGIVRVLHSLSFVDDPTRMLRAVRFEQRFGFQIEERTLQLLLEATSLLERVSGDRIRHELDHILDEDVAPQILERLDELGLLSAIHPDLKWDNWLRPRLEALQNRLPDADWELSQEELRRKVGYILWFLRLPEEQVISVCRRLKLSASLTDAILSASQLWRDLPGLSEVTPSQAVERLQIVPRLARYGLYLATSDIHLRRILQLYVTRWRKVYPTIDGHSLRDRGLPPGPLYRRILDELRAAWLDGKVTNKEEEQAFLEALIEDQ